MEKWNTQKNKIYEKQGQKKERQITNKSDQNFLAKLQSDHHVELREYMNLTNPDQNKTYPQCRFRVSDELMTPEHWLCDCVAHAARRMELFGKHKRRFKWLVRARDRYRVCPGHLGAYTG